MRYLALALLLAGCAVAPCYDDQYQDVTSYPVQPTTKTPCGIQVDDPRGELDLQEVDARSTEVVQCLLALYPDHHMPPGVVQAGHCLRDTIEPLKACLVVKVAPDWAWTPATCDTLGQGAQQVFPCGVDPQLCVAKGLVVTPECPCECRGAVQGNSTVITTPDLHLYDQDLIRLLTTCNWIWTPGLQECFRG